MTELNLLKKRKETTNKMRRRFSVVMRQHGTFENTDTFRQRRCKVFLQRCAIVKRIAAKKKKDRKDARAVDQDERRDDDRR